MSASSGGSGVPAPTIDDCPDVLQALRARRREMESRRDLRAVFTYAYEIMTERIEETLDSSGYADSTWVRDLMRHFSSAYFEALDAERLGAAAPEGWRHAFEHLRRRGCSALDAMLLGMIAHIVWDLPRVLAKMRKGPSDSAQLHDFQRMNAVLCASIDDIQRRVSHRYDPLLAWIDRWVGREDEYLTAYGIRMARAMAWYNADRMLNEALVTEAELSTTKGAESLMNSLMRPKWWPLRAALMVIRCASRLTRRWPPDDGAYPHDNRRMSRGFLWLVGLVYVASWLLPACDIGVLEVGPNDHHKSSPLPGWWAFTAAISPLFSWHEADGHTLRMVMWVMTALTNVVFMWALVRFFIRPAVRTANWAIGLVCAAAMNMYWLLDPDIGAGLLGGYYLWLASFVLLAIVTRMRIDPSPGLSAGPPVAARH